MEIKIDSKWFHIGSKYTGKVYKVDNEDIYFQFDDVDDKDMGFWTSSVDEFLKNFKKQKTKAKEIYLIGVGIKEQEKFLKASGFLFYKNMKTTIKSLKENDNNELKARNQD